MSDYSPITPPLELVQQWWEKADQHVDRDDPKTYFDYIATKAAQWGADQELEACCKDIIEIIAGVFADRVIDDWDQFVELLRDGRRPQPPSLKEQALEALQFVDEKLDLPLHNHCNAIHTIRRALEALDD